jgi:hypothetical protein
MRSTMMRTGSVLVMLAAVAACNRGNDSNASTDAASGTATPAQTATAVASAVASGGESVSVTTNTGSATISGGEAGAEAAVAALGVPLFPGATVLSSIVGEEGGERGAMVTIETRATPADVANFYRDRLAGAGFTIKAQANVGDVRIIGAEKGDRSLAVQVSAKEGGGSTVALMGGAR